MPLLQNLNSLPKIKGTEPRTNPWIRTKSQSGTFSSTPNPTLNVRREDIFYREDIKVTFAYALIGVSAIAILTAVGYMGIQQLRK